MSDKIEWKKFLDRKGLKKSQAARLIGAAPAMITEWMKEKSLPTYRYLKELANAGMTSQEMFGVEIGNKLVENSLENRRSFESEPIDYKSPEFQALVKKALIEIEAEKNGINR